MNLVTFVPTPNHVPTEIDADPVDIISLSITAENKAHLIIAGDNHLLGLKEHESSKSVKTSEAVRVIETLFL